MTLIDFAFSKLRTPKAESDKCLKSAVSEDASKSNMVNVAKHCYSEHRSTFIIFIDHCESIESEKISLIGMPNLGTAC